MANPRWASTSSTSWSTAANWDSGSVPVSTDTAYLENNAINIDTGLSQSAVTLAALYAPLTYTGKLGTVTTLGSGYLDISATVAYFGAAGTGTSTSNGSQRFKHNAGSNVCTWTIYDTCSTTADAGLPPVRIKGTHASNKLYLMGGSVGVAIEDADETSTLSEFSVTGSTSNLYLGSGVTWTTAYQTDGSVVCNTGGTTYTQTSGTLTLQGTNQIRTLTVGGTAILNARCATLSISGITRSSTTATATVASTATLATGDYVRIMGADQQGYNGYKQITVASGTTFTFTTDDGDETPATGTMTCRKAITAITLTDSQSLADFSGDSRNIDVATMTIRAGTFKVNEANPSHLHIGTLTLDSATSLQAA